MHFKQIPLEVCMLQKSLQDAIIVNYMLNQPFIVPYDKEDITQLSSFIGFNEKGIPSFDIGEAIQEHFTYPNPAETLLL